MTFWLRKQEHFKKPQTYVIIILFSLLWNNCTWKKELINCVECIIYYMQSVHRDFGGIVVLSWQLAQTWHVWGSFFNVSILKWVAKNVMCECSNCCYRNSLQRARTGCDSLLSNTHLWPCYMRNDLEGYFYCGALMLCPVGMSLLGLHIAGWQNSSPFLWKRQALVVLWREWALKDKAVG